MEGKDEIIVEMSEMCLRALHSVHELELTVSFVQKHRALLPFLSTATYSFGRPSKAQVFFHCSAQNAVLLIQPQSLRPRTGKKLAINLSRNVTQAQTQTALHTQEEHQTDSLKPDQWITLIAWKVHYPRTPSPTYAQLKHTPPKAYTYPPCSPTQPPTAASLPAPSPLPACAQ
jgi:hypothetical protein